MRRAGRKLSMKSSKEIAGGFLTLQWRFRESSSVAVSIIRMIRPSAPPRKQQQEARSSAPPCSAISNQNPLFSAPHPCRWQESEARSVKIRWVPGH